MASHQHKRQEQVLLLPEISVSELTHRINSRRELPEFRECAVLPDLDAKQAEAEIGARRRARLAEILEMRTALQQLERKLRRLRNMINPLLVVAGIVSIALIAYGCIDLTSPHARSYLHNHAKALEPRTRAVAALLIGIAGIAIVLWTWRSLPRDFRTARDIKKARDNVVADTNELNALLDQEVDRLLRLDANAKGEKLGSLALTPEAPGLVEFESVIPVDTPDITRLHDLVFHASTSAFALAGPRGIGKTTLIMALTADQKLFDLASVVPAPVKYDPDALLRRIHADIARQILVKHKAMDLLASMQQSMNQRTQDLRRNLAIAALATGFILLLLNLVQLPILGSIGDAGIFGIILIFAAYIILVNLKNRKFAPAGDDSQIIQNAVDALESLRWSTEETQTAKTSFSASKIFVGLEDTDASTRRERDRARPQLVDDLASFLHRHLELTSRWRRNQPDYIRGGSSRIIIAVDELDKLSDPEQIMEAVNSLKDLFRIPDVHFLVSVSNDVMTRFALRGVVSRDAFDSSFDAVIELRRLTCRESYNLLSERAIGFPKSLTAVCHAWSGGLPRDLIRVARRCVELRRTTQITRIDELAALVISQDIAQTLAALRITEHQMHGNEDRPTPSVLTSLINELIHMGKSAGDKAPSLVSTAKLNDLLYGYLYTGNRMHSAVRSPAIKLLVGGVLTVTLADAAVNGKVATDGEQMFAAADPIATVNSLQSEALGEVIAAASQAITEMRGLAIPVALNLERIIVRESDTPVSRYQATAEIMRRLLRHN